MVRIIGLLKLIAVWLVLIVAIGEVFIRLFVSLPIDYVDEKSSCYRYDSTLGWFPQENSECVHSAKFEMEISHNEHGFRDRPYTQAFGNPSIVVLGDSFVWGYDVRAEKRFTEVMQAFLPDWTIRNMGVSGYGTDQEWLLLQEWYPKYAPDIVIVVVHSNDSGDNRTNYRFNYFKPYFEKVENELVLRGTPVPKPYRFQKAEHHLIFRSHFVRGLAVLYNAVTKPETVDVVDLKLPLIAAMNDFVTERGSLFRLVFTYANDDPREVRFLQERNIRYLHVPEAAKFKAYGQHWTEEGHSYVAAKILEQLYLDGVIIEADLDKYPDLS